MRLAAALFALFCASQVHAQSLDVPRGAVPAAVVAGITFVGELGVNHGSGNSLSITSSGFDCPTGSLLLVSVDVDVDRSATDAVTTSGTAGPDTLTRGGSFFNASPSQLKELFWGITTHDTPIGGTIKYCAVAACTSAFTDINVAARCFSGLSTTDISTTWQSTGAGTSLNATATGTLGAANELVYLQGGINTAGSAPACTNSATLLNTATGAPSAYAVTDCYKIVAATTTQTMGEQWTGTTGAQNQVMTFK